MIGPNSSAISIDPSMNQPDSLLFLAAFPKCFLSVILISWFTSIFDSEKVNFQFVCSRNAISLIEVSPPF